MTRSHFDRLAFTFTVQPLIENPNLRNAPLYAGESTTHNEEGGYSDAQSETVVQVKKEEGHYGQLPADRRTPRHGRSEAAGLESVQWRFLGING